MDSIYLHGSEDVRSAGHAMQSAATEMQRAADNISGSLDRHQRFLEQWLLDFQRILEEGLKK